MTDLQSQLTWFYAHIDNELAELREIRIWKDTNDCNKSHHAALRALKRQVEWLEELLSLDSTANLLTMGRAEDQLLSLISTYRKEVEG